MTAFRPLDDSGGDLVQMVRNHEVDGFGGKFTDPAYDPDAGGGTSTLTFDLDAGAFVDSHASLSGTVRNCAGGSTTWGTWLTCEETSRVNPVSGLVHGYMFDPLSRDSGGEVPLAVSPQDTPSVVGIGATVRVLDRDARG